MRQDVDCYQSGECCWKIYKGKACVCTLLKTGYAANQKCPWQKKDARKTNGTLYNYNRKYADRKRKEEAEEEAKAVAEFEKRKREMKFKGLDLINEDEKEKAYAVLKK